MSAKDRRLFRIDIRGSDALAAMATSAGLPEAVAAAQTAIMSRQSPAMADKDEFVFLLHTAAEIEHMLLVQYLYAAYSAIDGADRDLLLAIAREEMGHLMCIQNMLIALGAPLNFERQDYPFNELYPFPFTLQPLSLRWMLLTTGDGITTAPTLRGSKPYASRVSHSRPVKSTRPIPWLENVSNW